MKAVVVILAALGVAACHTTRRTAWRYPVGLETVCRQAREQAWTCAVGVAPKEIRVLPPYVVKTVPAAFKAGQWWMLADGRGGYTLGSQIVLPANPQNPADVSREALLHETLHIVLQANGIMAHDQRFAGCAAEWRD